MKALTTILAVVLSLALLSACGSGDYKLKVSWEDETESSEDSGGSSTASDDGETDGESEDDGETTTAEDSDDTDGGIEYLEQDDANSGDRHFMGTYTFLEDSYFYYGGSYLNACEYGFPLNVRAYSHDDVIDFENASGQLVWIADIYEDETFDFEVGFLNKFGNPSIELVCTCYIEEPYWDYNNDEVTCSCEPSNDDENCAVIYEKLEN